MPSFGTESLANLTTCHPALQHIFHAVVKDFDCSIICGHRDKEAQDKVFREKKSKVQWPNSKHNKFPSLAVDVAPYPEVKVWKPIKRFNDFGFFVKGVAHAMHQRGDIEHLLRWGGDWDGDHDTTDQSFNDLVHFELIPINR